MVLSQEELRECMRAVPVAVQNGDYRRAARVLARLVEAGELDLAAGLLMVEVQPRAGVAVNQSMKTVGCGSTVIGYQG